MENKTVPTGASVNAFLDAVDHPVRRADGHVLCDLMQRATGVEPQMWGPAIVGFGSAHYRYESGREGDMPRVGFSPRKANLALYLTQKGARVEELLTTLGRHKRGGSCLYINKLADIDLSVLELMVAESWARSAETYGPNAAQYSTK